MRICLCRLIGGRCLSSLVALLFESCRQFVFFVGSSSGSSWTPLSPVLASTSYPSQPLIPFAQFWTLLNLAHHIHTIVSIDAIRPTLHDPLFSWDQHRSWPITAIPPALCLLLRPQDVAQCAWWSIPLLMAGLCIVVTKWNNDGRADVMRLETLKYEAKGA